MTHWHKYGEFESVGLSQLAEILQQSLLPAMRAKAQVVFLQGQVGAGKTTLVAALLPLLGSSEQAQSPTYPILLSYQTSDRLLWHMDAYRLSDRPEEAQELLDAAYVPGEQHLIVEWAEYGVENIQPADWRIEIQLTAEGKSRRMMIYQRLDS